MKDSGILKDYISDAILRGIKFAPRTQYMYLADQFIKQDALIDKSEIDLMYEMFKGVFENRTDIDEIQEKCKGLKERDNNFFNEIMKAECLRVQYSDLFNSLIEGSHPRDETYKGR